ncbi:MAG: CUB domain-containing protein [Bacteroidota bacterium]
MKKIISTLFLLLFLGFAADAQTYTMSTSTVTTCSGTFYDSGGAAGNYSNNENSTMTFTSGNGNRLSFNFSTMSMSLGDYMIIYDGPTTSHPIIGTYDTNPGVINSTGTSLTFFFFSTSSSTSTGWAATISCTTAPLTIYNLTSGTVTACSGAFYDNAGAAANYTDNLNITQTFCSGTTDRLQFSFLQSLQSSNLALGDTLFIYDGATTSAPLLSVHVNGSNFETFTTSGTCATFRFKSNASGNSIGWAGQFQCTSTPPAQGSFNMSAGVRYVCNAMFYDNGGAANNYSNNLNLTQTFTFTISI